MRILLSAMILSLAACGSSSKPSATDAAPAQNAETQPDTMPTPADVRAAYERKIASLQSVLGGDMRVNNIDLGACHAEGGIVSCQATVDIAVDGQNSSSEATIQLRRTAQGFDLVNMPGMDVEQNNVTIHRSKD